jgi:hypothetical protein
MKNLGKKTLPPIALRRSQVHATLDPKLNLAMPMAIGLLALFLGGSWPWVVQ